MAEVDCLADCIELDHMKPVLDVPPIQNILGRLQVVLVGDTGTIPHHLCTESATSFPAHLASASRALAMAAGCALSTGGLWNGPVIYIM